MRDNVKKFKSAGYDWRVRGWLRKFNRDMAKLI